MKKHVAFLFALILLFGITAQALGAPSSETHKKDLPGQGEVSSETEDGDDVTINKTIIEGINCSEEDIKLVEELEEKINKNETGNYGIKKELEFVDMIEVEFEGTDPEIIKIKIDGVTPDSTIQVLILEDGQWVLYDVPVNENGEIELKVKTGSIIAIFADAKTAKEIKKHTGHKDPTQSPKTGDAGYLEIMVIVMMLAICAIIVSTKKRAKM